MLRTILILTVFVSYIKVNAQSTALGVVNYGQIESMGMGSPIGLDYNAVLLFNKNEAIYITRQDSLENGHIYEMVKTKVDESYSIIQTKATNELGLQYYQNKDSIYNRDLGFKYVKDKLPEINWQFTSDIKKIGRFNCNKAIASFRGRKYTAWYTVEIPIPFGPWKLHGLPGLILEAYDTHKEVFFYFKSIKYPIKETLIIKKPQSKYWINAETFKKEMVIVYKNAISSGRMISESIDAPSMMDEKKLNMGNTYIEIFFKEQ